MIPASQSARSISLTAAIGQAWAWDQGFGTLGRVIRREQLPRSSPGSEGATSWGQGCREKAQREELRIPDGMQVPGPSSLLASAVHTFTQQTSIECLLYVRNELFLLTILPSDFLWVPTGVLPFISDANYPEFAADPTGSRAPSHKTVPI